MKRMSGPERPTPRFRRAIKGARLLLVGVLLTGAVSSCNLFTYTKPFADEYYTSNYIANIGFDKFVGADTTVPSSSVTGSWDFTYRYENWDQYPYMTLEKVSDSGYETAGGSGFSGETLPDGLSSSAPVYRLELKNLVQGGDFEASGAATTGWTITPSSYGTPTVEAVSSGAINGQSLSLTFKQDASSSYALAAVSGQFVTGNQYSLDFRWLYSGTWPNEQGMTIDGDPIGFNTETNHATKQFSVGSSVPPLVFAPEGSVSRLTIDDLTVRKTGSMRLRLLLASTDTTPSLGSFLYRFTFWVHEDPSVGASTSPYHLDVLAPNMLPTDYSTMSTKTYGSYAYSSTSSGWTKMTVEVENGNLQFSDATKPVLELIIDLDSSLPGRVLLAQPELYAYPDGY